MTVEEKISIKVASIGAMENPFESIWTYQSVRVEPTM